MSRINRFLPPFTGEVARTKCATKGERMSICSKNALASRQTNASARMSRTGACLCGAVSFRISGNFESFFLCHCARCRKDTGSAFAANLFSSTAEITWLSGNDRIKTYRVPATRHARSFCAECGSALPSVQANGALLVVPAGSLDGAIGMKPNAHICFADRAEWDHQLEDIPKMKGLPA
jgi:hypothetical protein